jgi:hypothetical protein
MKRIMGIVLFDSMADVDLVCAEDLTGIVLKRAARPLVPPSSWVVLLARCRLKLGKIFQDDGQQFGGCAISRTRGPVGCDCLLQQSFRVGLRQNPISHESAESNVGKLKAGNSVGRSVSLICLVRIDHL